MMPPCKIRVSNVILMLNRMRSRFAKPCKDTKIFVVRAKFFRFKKNFGSVKGGVLCKDARVGRKYAFSRLRFPTSKTRGKKIEKRNVQPT